MICGCSDMLLLLFTVCSVASISRVFSILANRSSPVHRLQGFANGIVCYGNPYPIKWLCLHQWLLITDFACNLTIRLSCHCHYLLRVEPYYASNTASGDRYLYTYRRRTDPPGAAQGPAQSGGRRGPYGGRLPGYSGTFRHPPPPGWPSSEPQHQRPW